MELKPRTILIALVSLAALLGIYLLCNRISETPEIDIDTTDGLGDTIDNNSVGALDGELGKIGDVGVGTVTKFEYLHRDDKGNVDRKFGFKELLHRSQGRWETREPYIDILHPGFECKITSDNGDFQLDRVAGRLSPKDGTFTGNVVMHILPQPDSDMKEAFLYLDDVAFVSEKSLFWTPGPIRLVSEDARMFSRGLELIYNDQLKRVESFRIIHLDSLRLKGSPAGWLGQSASAEKDPAKKLPLSSQQAGPRDPNAGAAPEDPNRRPGPRLAGTPGEYYRCVFSKNVVMDSPDHFIFADDKISISNIFWSRTQSSTGVLPEPAGPNDVDPNSALAAKDNEPNESPETFGDVVITCDDGILIEVMDAPGVRADAEESNVEVADPNRQLPAVFSDLADRPATVARAIYHDLATGDTILAGPVELSFRADVNDLIAAEANQPLLPVTVTAQNHARILAEAHQVVLQGDCVATMVWDDPNVQQKYRLSADTFTIDLREGVDYQSSIVAGDVKHLTADGGAAKLTIIRTAGSDLLGGVELKCRQIDYDAEQPLFAAAGPGLLTLDNSRFMEPSPKPGGFSLRKRCYAFLQFFDTLKYFMAENRIVADARPQETLQIDYFPVIEGQYGKQAVATANHVELNLVETEARQAELSTLIASGAVTYRDEDNEFAGAELFYDRDKAIMKVEGDESAPCLFNGALVERIVYDLKTGKVETQVAGPGALQIK